MPREVMADLIYGEARKKYEQRKQDGTLPTFCRVLDNLANNTSAHLTGCIADDPVYVFLIEAQSIVREVATQQYKATRVEGLDPTQEIDMQECVSTKEAFLGSLIDSMEKRRGEPSLSVDWSRDAIINSSQRYHHLSRMSGLTGEDRALAIRNLIERAPSYS